MTPLTKGQQNWFRLNFPHEFVDYYHLMTFDAASTFIRDINTIRNDIKDIPERQRRLNKAATAFRTRLTTCRKCHKSTLEINTPDACLC